MTSATPFGPALDAWFASSFGDPTPAQQQTWPAVGRGEHVLLSAPTGSGKTLAAFLSAIDVLSRAEPRESGVSVLYISPLKALAVDVDKNLRAPIRGAALAGQRMGAPFREPTVGIRTGDTTAAQRRDLARHPPDILITTPESLFLMLTSAVRDTLRSVTTVIIDEIHAVAGTKRGAHLALSVERLAELADGPIQRIGLSATQRPLSEIAEFLCGFDLVDGVSVARPVSVIEASQAKTLSVSIEVPVDDMTDPAASRSIGQVGAPSEITVNSIWPSLDARIVELIEQHRSTIVFVNNRRTAERLASRLNEILDVDHDNTEAGANSLVAAHHGSLSQAQRRIAEDALKSGELRGLVATSSMELGIDMGAVDLVIQIESPPSVAAGLQRVGRAGHQVHAVSTGVLFPKHRMDLIECAVVASAMLAREVEDTRYIRNPLDVLAQHLVSMVALDTVALEDLMTTLACSAPFHDCSAEVIVATLDMLDGRYPSEQFAELKPRVVWDRATNQVRGRSGAQRLAVSNAGTITDRGLFTVVLPDGKRVGELDEEMVYESRPGESFLLGATTWRIEEITPNQVVVTPAPGAPGKMPFWRGDGLGRPFALGTKLGGFLRAVEGDPERTLTPLRDSGILDEAGAANIAAFVRDQQAVTGVVPSDVSIVVERFRDEIGDWRVCILTPFGTPIHAPWAIAIRARLEAEIVERLDIMWSDDGIIFRLPDGVDEIDLDLLFPDPGAIRDEVVSQLGSSALFATKFREAAARSLLLPRRRVDQRTPLWQQRQRSANLLEVASAFPEFPILLEATRECCQDVFDLGGLANVLEGVQRREIRVVPAISDSPSPFSRSMLFEWISVFMYQGDSPLAEQRAGALNLDPDLLRELLGTDELRSLLSESAIATVEDQLQWLAERRHARSPDELHDLFRTLGPLSLEQIEQRAAVGREQLVAWCAELDADRRAIEIDLAGHQVWIDAADAGRSRDAFGVAVPQGLPSAFVESQPDPLKFFVARFAQTHGPFTIETLAANLPARRVELDRVLETLRQEGRLTSGAFLPSGSGIEWCDPEVLRRIRKASLQELRAEIAPTEPAAMVEFVIGWHNLHQPRAGRLGVIDAIGQLDGCPLVASAVESDVLAARVERYQPSVLDEVMAEGEFVWMGVESLGPRNGRIRLMSRATAPVWTGDVTSREQHWVDAGGPHGAIVERLRVERSGFWGLILGAVADAGANDSEVALSALWDLVWDGVVSSDSLTALRAFLRGSSPAARGSGRVGARAFRQLRSAGPPSATGRWWLVSSLVEGVGASATELATVRASLLLERYGVLTREMARAEGIAAGFAGLYPVLNELEAGGEIRRGYFVDGLGGVQFALSHAVDRLRTGAANPTAVVVTATDPAQPFGASLPWPPSAGKPIRSAKARVVIGAGEAVAWIDRDGRSVLTFVDDHSRWIDPLVDCASSGRMNRLEIVQIDGVAAGRHPAASLLVRAGFVDGYRGMRWVERP